MKTGDAAAREIETHHNPNLRDQLIEWILSCQHSGGGFSRSASEGDSQ